MKGTEFMQPKRQGRRRSPAKPKICRFCEAKVTYIDFKDAETLSKFQTEKGKIMLFAVMFVFTGIEMIGIGMIGEYIGRIYNDVRARPRYFIEEIFGRNAEK